MNADHNLTSGWAGRNSDSTHFVTRDGCVRWLFQKHNSTRMRSDAEVADGPGYLSTAALQVSQTASVSRQ